MPMAPSISQMPMNRKKAIGRSMSFVMSSADMMNFIVFGLGGNSAPKGTKPYTAAEVGRLRTRALATQSLIAERTEVVGKMVASCRVPKSMNYFYDGQEQAAR